CRPKRRGVLARVTVVDRVDRAATGAIAAGTAGVIGAATAVMIAASAVMIVDPIAAIVDRTAVTIVDRTAASVDPSVDQIAVRSAGRKTSHENSNLLCRLALARPPRPSGAFS